MRVSADPWGVAAQPAGAFIERGGPARRIKHFDMHVRHQRPRIGQCHVEVQPASLGSDIDRRQTLRPALVFGQHERRIALFSRHDDFTQPIGKPDCHNAATGRSVIKYGIGRGIGRGTGRGIGGKRRRCLWRQVWRGLRHNADTSP